MPNLRGLEPIGRANLSLRTPDFWALGPPHLACVLNGVTMARHAPALHGAEPGHAAFWRPHERFPGSGCLLPPQFPHRLVNLRKPTSNILGLSQWLWNLLS